MESSQLKKINLRVLTIFGLIVIVFVVLLFIVIKFIVSQQTIRINDTDVPRIKTTYQDMKSKLVHGEVHGVVQSTKNFSGRQISFCTITKGEIIKRNGIGYVSCGKNDIKQTTIDDQNQFTIRLQPGTWFMNILLNSSEESTDIPARINVHTGATATIAINVQ